MDWNLFAPCPRGLEPSLAAELAGLGAGDCRAVAGGVAFSGDRRVAYMANLHSRLASRVLREVGRRRYRAPDDLYRLAAGIEWERHFDGRHTLRVDTSATRSPLRSLNFATLRIKDAIVDRLRERTGDRPSIDTRSPDARVWLFLEPQEATLYLDLSGEPLFKRGWRSGRDDGGDAPLKENLAAGLLVLAGWTPEQPLVDPFCGSGTIAIEAASIACDLAPGLSRGFGFERLLDHDAALWAGLRGDAIRRAQAGAARIESPAAGKAAPTIAASDIDADAVSRARRNQARAGLPDAAIRWRVADAAKLSPPFAQPGLVVANPPYGERLDAQGAGQPAHEAAMHAIGDCLRRSWSGWRIWMLSADPALPRQLGMKESRRTPLFNGAIECRFFRFDVFGPPERPTGQDRPSRP
ncbi:THUMP domain-containing protein [Burkholderiaceae bacterium FT117]|uniref:THUMP domain-containing class I SAM-dependent RNA methyltransferase n=1 Tax=Zeimonas sediminis TaxID=2944268 RepID=UPI002342D895|nr:THUMP domain-containing protein [Zeimonas sediminis]MCM5570002.1 THUMP domain-containing protein [Zeimonas sediminis]